MAAGLELPLPGSFQHESTNPVDGEVKTPRKLVIYRGVCRERFCCHEAAHLRISLGLYDVSVHCLQSFRGSQFWRECVRVAIVQTRCLRITFAGFLPTVGHPSATNLSVGARPRLVLQLSGNIWHTASFSIPVLRTGDFHPTSSRPCWAYP